MNETELSSGDKGAVTRWRNRVAELEEQLDQLENQKPALSVHTTPKSDNSGQSRRRDAVSLIVANPVGATTAATASCLHYTPAGLLWYHMPVLQPSLLLQCRCHYCCYS